MQTIRNFSYVFPGIALYSPGQYVNICMWPQRFPGEADSDLGAEAVEEVRSEWNPEIEG